MSPAQEAKSSSLYILERVGSAPLSLSTALISCFKKQRYGHILGHCVKLLVPVSEVTALKKIMRDRGAGEECMHPVSAIHTATQNSLSITIENRY